MIIAVLVGLEDLFKKKKVYKLIKWQKKKNAPLLAGVDFKINILVHVLLIIADPYFMCFPQEMNTAEITLTH